MFVTARSPSDINVPENLQPSSISHLCTDGKGRHGEAKAYVRKLLACRRAKNDNKKYKVRLQTAFLCQTISRGLTQNEMKTEITTVSISKNLREKCPTDLHRKMPPYFHNKSLQETLWLKQT